MIKTISSVLILTSVSFFMASCQQNGASSNKTLTYTSKINFSYERYFLRKAECKIKSSDYIQAPTHKIESILNKVEAKATKAEANWVVITGLGEGEVQDHYFFESYKCDQKQEKQIISALGEVNHNLKFVQSDMKRLDDSLKQRHYPTFKLYMRSKLGQ